MKNEIENKTIESDGKKFRRVHFTNAKYFLLKWFLLPIFAVFVLVTATDIIREAAFSYLQKDNDRYEARAEEMIQVGTSTIPA